ARRRAWPTARPRRCGGTSCWPGRPGATPPPGCGWRSRPRRSAWRARGGGRAWARGRPAAAPAPPSPAWPSSSSTSCRRALAPARLQELKAFQAARLARSYADIAAMPRYREATAFFLADLYGPKNFSRRDAAMLRILPAMTRMLPASAVETATLAVELEALSE